MKVLPVKIRFNTIGKYILIAVLSLSLTLAYPLGIMAQVPFINMESDNTSSFTPWWQLNQSTRCGRFWCNEVHFPYFPYGFFAEGITIVARPDLEDVEATARALENRVNTVEKTLLGIFRRITNHNIYELPESWRERIDELEQSQEIWYYLRFYSDKPIHPLTPQIESGIRNEQTVLFVPEQLELGLSAQTIITVTDDDSIYHGKPRDELAKNWREIMRRNLSEALWGYEFDRRYPWGRLAIIGVLLILIIIPTILLSLMRGFLHDLDLRFRRKLSILREKAKQDKLDAYMASIGSQNQEIKPEVVNSPRDLPNTKAENTQKEIKIFNVIFNYFNQLTLRTIRKHKKNLVEYSLQQENLLKQGQNVILLMKTLLFWGQFLLLFIGLAFIASIYPWTRIYSFFFLGQGVIIPLIWMAVRLAHSFTSFGIDYYLTRWAHEKNIVNPNSSRLPMRVNTYTAAFKGASNFLYIMLGIYFTIVFIGIDTSILAGAGALALLIGFLGRNILENMLNGVLILWTDRCAVGDVVKIGDAAGFVENMNLYTTQLRGAEGRLITIPNGQISIVENLTKDWSRVDFIIDISYHANARKVFQIIEEVCEQMRKEPEWGEMILESANILGVDQVSHEGIRIQTWIRTQPITQWAVGRELRLRVQEKLQAADIQIGIPQREIRQKYQ